MYGTFGRFRLANLVADRLVAVVDVDANALRTELRGDTLGVRVEVVAYGNHLHLHRSEPRWKVAAAVLDQTPMKRSREPNGAR